MEIELKFIVPPERLAALAADLRQGGDTREERLEARYFDTPDERLAAHAVAFRLRSEGGRWVQTVKALTPDSLRRLEHNVDRDTPENGAPAPDVALHDGTPAGAALREALAGAGPGPAALVERFRTEVDRLTRLESSDGALVELALDTGRVVAGDRADAVCELELELKSGPVRGLFDLAGRWAVDRGLWLGTVTKAARGGRLVPGAPAVAPVGAEPPEADPRAGPGPFLAAVFEACLRQVLGNASEVGAGATDPGFVHQLRIGLRRLRTALRELADVADGVDPGWEPVFRAAFQALGAHRDAETVLPQIREELREAGIAYVPPAAPVAASASAASIVRGVELQRALLEVLALCQVLTVPRPPEKRARRRLRQRVARRLDRLHADLARDARRFVRLSPERQHRARKRLKRLRYLAEFAAPLFGPKRVRRYLKAWRAAQDALGESNDHRVGLALIRADERPGTERRRAVRWMIGTQQELVERCERTLRKAVRRKVFWSA